MNMQPSKTSGFSLIESLVIISIISILTAMALSAIPAIRAHQELVADTENIRALLLDAKQRTLNQVRPEACLDGYDVDDPERAGCSDTGVALLDGEIIEFANTSKDGSPANGVRGYDSDDYVLTRSRLSSTVGSSGVTSLLFIGLPPSALLYSNGNELRGGSDSARITLTASDGSTRTIRVYSFGTIDIE